MFVFFGTRHYGKIDQIKNVGYVTTEYFHIQFVPLVPIRSIFLLGEINAEAIKVQIPLSLRSVLIAWFCSCLLLFGGCHAVVAGVLLTECELITALIPAALSLATIVIYLFTVMKTGIGKASQSKREQLGEIALQVYKF